ncbi:MAG: hypothetical protein AAFY08_13375 [Planctomycetota bacterium]
MHRQVPTSTALAAAIAALAATSPCAPSAAAPLGVVVDETRKGDFTTFTGDFSPQWYGDIARVKEKGNGYKLKSPKPGVVRGLTPGVSTSYYAGSVTYDGSISSFDSVMFALFTQSAYDNWSQADVSRLGTPFRIQVEPSADLLNGDDADTDYQSFDYLDYDSRQVTTTLAKVKLDGVKAKASDASRSASNDHDLYRFSEVVLEQSNGKDQRLANASAVAEVEYFESRVSASALAQPDAKAKASARGVAQEAQTYDIARTQVVEVNGWVNVRGGGRVNVELVDLNAGETLVSWTSDTLPADGRYDVDLLTAIDAGDGRDGVADLEIRLSTDAAANAKAKSSKVRVVSAAEYGFSERFHTPSGYVAPQWTYTPASWTALNGPNAGETASVGETIVVTGGPGGDLPGPVWQALPFDPATLGTDDYVGPYALAESIRAQLDGPLAEAMLTPTRDGKYFVSFGDDVIASPDGITRGHMIDLFNALIAQGFETQEVAQALLIDLAASPDHPEPSYLSEQAVALDGPQANQLVDVLLVEAEGPTDWLWEAIEFDYTPGEWSLTREEYVPSAEEALATYAAENGIDLGVVTDEVVAGPTGTRLAVSLTDEMLGGSSTPPAFLAIGQQLPEDLTINGSAALLASADPVVNPTPTAAAGGLAGLVVLLRRRRVGRG